MGHPMETVEQGHLHTLRELGASRIQDVQGARYRENQVGHNENRLGGPEDAHNPDSGCLIDEAEDDSDAAVGALTVRRSR